MTVKKYRPFHQQILKSAFAAKNNAVNQEEQSVLPDMPPKNEDQLKNFEQLLKNFDTAKKQFVSYFDINLLLKIRVVL